MKSTAASTGKKAGSIFVTKAPDFDANVFEQLVELEALSGADLLAKRRERLANYSTAPFDPDGNLLRFYPGGISIWSGFPGSGKTTLLRQQICHLLHRGSSVFLASLEEDPADVITELAATAAGGDPTAHQVQWFVDEYHDRFRLWGVIGVARYLQLLGCIRTLSAIGVEHVVIDSLMRLDVPNDDNEALRRFSNLLSITAKTAKVHIHLVAHPRKLIKADAELDLNDVAGAKELVAVADSVLFVRRDLNRASYSPTADATPMCISIRKQRYNRGILGDAAGWFQRPLNQFTLEQFPTYGAVRYLPADAYSNE